MAHTGSSCALCDRYKHHDANSIQETSDDLYLKAFQNNTNHIMLKVLPEKRLDSTVICTQRKHWFKLTVGKLHKCSRAQTQTRMLNCSSPLIQGKLFNEEFLFDSLIQQYFKPSETTFMHLHFLWAMLF